MDSGSRVKSAPCIRQISTWVNFLSSRPNYHHRVDLSTDKPCPGRRYLVLLADTWLHIATSTVVFTEVSDSVSTTSSFGRGFYSDECNSTYPCSVAVGTGSFLVGASEAYRTLANISLSVDISQGRRDLCTAYRHKDLSAHRFQSQHNCHLNQLQAHQQ